MISIQKVPDEIEKYLRAALSDLPLPSYVAKGQVWQDRFNSCMLQIGPVDFFLETLIVHFCS
jgi:hypothetical protein